MLLGPKWRVWLACIDSRTSGKAPHYDASRGPIYGESYANVQITSGSAKELVDRFLAAAYTVEDNPHHQQEPS